MDEEKLYKQAMKDIKNLVEDVMKQCEQFADNYNYEKEWVFSRFKEELNKSIKDSR